MTYSLFYKFCSYMCEGAISHSILLIFIFVIIGERIRLKKLGKLLLISAVVPVGLGFLLHYVTDMKWMPAYAITSAATFVFSTAAVVIVLKYDRWRAFSMVCIAAILQVSSATVADSVMQSTVLSATGNLNLYFAAYYAGIILAALGIGSFLYKMDFSRLIRYLLEDERQLRMRTVWIFGLELIVELFSVMRGIFREEAIVTYNTSMIILTVLLVGFLTYFSGKKENERKIQYQESMLLQQQMYVEHLEQMQKEMRVFRHDYKNTLSGMYLYAKEGKAEKIQEVLKKLEIDFDQKIGEKIHAATQIGNISLPEIKSLVLSKLTKMNQSKITCRLEVLYPVESIGIDVWEFNQCLGILLDNAIEAAAVQPDPYVELQLMYHGGYLAVRVANPWAGEAELSRMWEEGYSAKGENRGLGLSNYKRILERYPEAVAVTSCENQVFVQELTVPACSSSRVI